MAESMAVRTSEAAAVNQAARGASRTAFDSPAARWYQSGDRHQAPAHHKFRKSHLQRSGQIRTASSMMALKVPRVVMEAPAAESMAVQMAAMAVEAPAAESMAAQMAVDTP